MIDPTDRVLDWAPSHDPRSRSFAIRTLITTEPVRRNKLWRVGPILDQGREGACVGFGWTAENLATPIAVDLNRVAANVPRSPTAYAQDIYRRAQKIDEWAGENYEGTSVNAGAKICRENGTVLEYRWAFGINDVVNTVLAKGPVVLGINWYYNMYWAPNGVLKPGGELVGGHCLLAVGYVLKSPKLNGQDGLILQNSWGEDWGVRGLAEISLTDMDKLLRENGEAATATKRSYGRTLPKI